MSDNQENLIHNLILYTKMNRDLCNNKEFRRILDNILNYSVMVRDDEIVLENNSN